MPLHARPRHAAGGARPVPGHAGRVRSRPGARPGHRDRLAGRVRVRRRGRGLGAAARALPVPDERVHGVVRQSDDPVGGRPAARSLPGRPAGRGRRGAARAGQAAGRRRPGDLLRPRARPADRPGARLAGPVRRGGHATVGLTRRQRGRCRSGKHLLYYGGNYKKLQVAKRRWDPHQVFNHVLSVEPGREPVWSIRCNSDRSQIITRRYRHETQI
ncbi:MAG: hypothetical protein DYG89_14910 [Caldilinea sp. CFX5]|nr:hypothetical protein [Caldilinea sp. CFX5]